MSYTKTTHNTTYPSLSTFSSPSNTTVLITDGGTGIGRATALSFARSGARSIILLGRRQEVLASAAETIKSAYSSTNVTTHSVDILDVPSLQHVMSPSVSGRIDIVVHCAVDMPPLGPLADPNLDTKAISSTFEKQCHRDPKQ